jgi:hypothetical protein
MCKKQIDLIAVFDELIAGFESAEKSLNDSLAAIENKDSTTEIASQTFAVKLRVRLKNANIN